MIRLNVLINGLHESAGWPVLARGLRSFPIQRCINITSSALPPPLKTQEPIELHTGSIEDIDWNLIPPLDEELIEAMRSYEAVFLTMMNRNEGKGRFLSYAARKREYLQYLRYWSHFMKSREINLFISRSFPHRIRSYMLASLCKLWNIPALYFHQTSPIPALYYLSWDYETSIIGLPERFAELKKNPPPENAPLPITLERYLRAQTGQEGDPTPWFVHTPPLSPKEEHRRQLYLLFKKRAAKIRSQLKKALSKRMTGDYWSRAFRDRSRRRRAKTMFRFYDQNANVPDLSKRYIYLPLQLQPECTTCPMGGAYVDQILMVQMVSNLVPDDVLLYVKEHPNQERLFPDGACRDISFYRDLLAMPNVRLVPRKFNTFELMENAIAVATATGSAGFEGLFRGKPFLMFGHDYYQFAPGAYSIRSLEDCKRALHEVLVAEKKPTVSGMKLFLHALGDTTVPGYLSPDMQEVSVASQVECIENLGGMLERRIQESFDSHAS